jgi:DNA phosphorothioation-dependent restriction protein DptG
MLTWQQITGAARYGTDLISYTPFSESYIKQDIINYLCDNKTIGRVLNKNKLSVEVKIHSIEKIDYSLSLSNITSFNPLEVLDNIKSLTPVGQEKSSVEITYSYDLPFVLRVFGKETIQIKSYLEVLSGTGSPGESTRQ